MCSHIFVYIDNWKLARVPELVNNRFKKEYKRWWKEKKELLPPPLVCYELTWWLFVFRIVSDLDGPDTEKTSPRPLLLPLHL